ncbi:sulfite exporter TauE/SafE family protein [Actinomadura sp. NTSP31]|uniref:sulfite exporter TauE/SafE family protein n=1 Tax=Actinomadura sp. NTSP31 TaxID=1735447 RepID=UPI0035C0BA03
MLVAVGIVAGIGCTVVSIASLVSYPVLLALGLPPIIADSTNTVSLVFTGVGSAMGSKVELNGQWRRVVQLSLINAVGGCVGASALLVTSPEVFNYAIPVFVCAASILLLMQPRLRERRRPDRRGPGPPALFAGIFGVSVYTGYFGAAGGIIAVAILGAMINEPMVKLNALKNVTNVFANGMASVIFIMFGSVHFAAAIPLAAGFFVGGRIGPRLARGMSEGLLRSMAGTIGLLFSVKLGSDFYM